MLLLAIIISRVVGGLAHPQSGNALWFDTPAAAWASGYLPFGNGYLAGMASGNVTSDDIKLNIESLWSGGPFSDKNYDGQNHLASQRDSLAESMRGIRQNVFTSSNGRISNVSVLTADPVGYGSYSSAGALNIQRAVTASPSGYERWLDMDSGLVVSTWKEGNVTITREAFCSHPLAACFYHIQSSPPSPLNVTAAFTPISGLLAPQTSCSDPSTLTVRGYAAATTTAGMTYELMMRVITPGGGSACSAATGSAPASIDASAPGELWLVWTGDTNYDINAGDAAHSFSFQGADPHPANVRVMVAAVSPPTQSNGESPSYNDIKSAHIDDYRSAMSFSSFSLNLGQTPDLTKTTATLISAYKATDPSVGNPYIEWLAFNFGRYLLASSARGKLPANLQGKWARDSSTPWSGDYHANINVQQVYWSAESTNLDVTQSLWDYMQKTWAPRGTLTAQTLYNSSGWAVHNEINIFGATGMKSYNGVENSQWADYPAAAAWMMMHVWDHYDYGLGDITWWKSQGYPLMKGVAQFWLENLFSDNHFNDGTLVVNPCNSPEQTPITFGCAHWQQLIWELFNNILKGSNDAGETDTAFIASITTALSTVDRGIHIGKWGQLQEWKFDMDSPTDTHRHLSHLVGLYPGYSIASYNPTQSNNTNFTRQAVLNATLTSLVHRGLGTGPDADSGWEKAWRAACYAQLGDADTFYYELNYAVKRNFAPNLMSLYDPFDSDPIYQMDANGAYPATVMNGLIQAPDIPYQSSTPLTITLLPALPSAWGTGHLNGARVRGGIRVDFAWVSGKLTNATLTFDRAKQSKNVQVVYAGRILQSLTGNVGQTVSINVDG